MIVSAIQIFSAPKCTVLCATSKTVLKNSNTQNIAARNATKYSFWFVMPRKTAMPIKIRKIVNIHFFIRFEDWAKYLPILLFSPHQVSGHLSYCDTDLYFYMPTKRCFVTQISKISGVAISYP